MIKIGLLKVLKRERPERFVYAPNYWQWFAHHRNHGILPEEIRECKTQLEVIHYLGLDVFSRNIYCDEQKYWFGGMCDELWENVEVTITERFDGCDIITEKKYITKKGDLTEVLRYDFASSTLVQQEFLLNDYDIQLDVFETLVQSRKWKFNVEKFNQFKSSLDNNDVVIMGEVYSPLKLLHLAADPVKTTYLLMDYPERVKEILQLHEAAQLELVRQMVDAGVQVVMSMDNLDTMFHSPSYVEQYSASFYEKASKICHEEDSNFFIHACGQQKDNIGLISSLGVDGLEGVAYPPLGDIELDEAMKLSGDRFIITGGISAMEIRELKTRDQIFDYVKRLFQKMEPYSNRFIFSASCNTPFNTGWETIKHFRDAWQEYGNK